MTISECTDRAIYFDDLYMRCRRLRESDLTQHEKRQARELERICLRESRAAKWELAGHIENLGRKSTRH